MKKSEKNAVKNAFGIPAPRHKDEFIAEYQAKLESRRRSPVPVFFRYAAAAAFAAVIICLCIAKLPSPDKDFTGSDVIAEVTTSSSGNTGTSSAYSAVTTASEPSEISASSETASAVTTTASAETTSKVTTSDTDISGSTAVSATEKTTVSTQTTAQNTETSHSTETAQKTTSAKTTSAHTSATSSATMTTTAATSATYGTTQTTTISEEELPQTSAPQITESRGDYTVKPPVIYYPKDNNNGDPITDDRPGAAPGGSENTDKTTMPGNSSDTIVYGNVIRMYYTSINGDPYIQADIEISEVYRSWFLNAGDRISVYIPGGYVRNNDGSYTYYGAEFTPEQGRQYLLMLNMAYYPFQDKTFLLSRPAVQAAFTKNGYYYVSAVDSSLMYSTNELEKSFR